MFATWPMVFGALTAGVIAGFLLPENGPGSPSGSVAAVSDKSPAPKTKPEVATPVSVKTSVREAPVKNSERDEACENQTWPYLTPSCLDRSARNAPPAVVVKTRISEPPTEDSARAKLETKEAKPAKSPPVAVASAPADEARQQTQKAPAAAAAPEKAAQPVKQQAAQDAEEPERPRAKSQAPRRADRNRSERRHAGRDEFYDEARVYIQRGGRLYLAPEHRHRLYSQDGYGRQW